MATTDIAPREGHPSPWGAIQIAEELADGIVSVHTASHGGLWLSSERLRQMDESERSGDGWYEEDCEAAFVFRRFRDEIVHRYEADRLDRFIAATMDRARGSFASIAMRRGA